MVISQYNKLGELITEYASLDLPQEVQEMIDVFWSRHLTPSPDELTFIQEKHLA